MLLSALQTKITYFLAEGAYFLPTNLIAYDVFGIEPVDLIRQG